MTTGSIDRTRIIGGSDIAAVMGLSRWRTPLSLWAEKTGKLQNSLEGLEHVEIGTELEPYIAAKFTKKTGIKLRVDNRTFTHKQYPYMVAHIDRWVVGEDALFEAKTCSAWLAKEWAGDEIPQDYILQLNWYLGIVRKQKGYIAVLVGGQKFLHKYIEFDEDLFERQVEAARQFMEEFILKDMAPMAQAGDSDTLLQMYPESQPSQVQLEGELAEELDGLVEERLGGLESIRHAKEELEKIEARIKQILSENESAETSRVRVTWKTQHVKEFTVAAYSKRVLNAKEKK